MNRTGDDEPRRRPGFVPEALFAAAAAWQARLREPEPDPAMAAARRAAFERWLSADPCHAAAFDDAARLWRALAEPTARVMGEQPAVVTASRPGGRRFAASAPRLARLAAGVLAIAACGAIWRADIIDRLRSDHMTAVGEQAPLVLADGSRITLNTDSAVALDWRAERRQVRLLRGEAWFDVRPDADRPFVVETAAGAIRVTGTRFDVRLAGDAAIVSLTDGRVELTAAGDAAGVAPVVLQPGQQARLSAAGVSEATVFDGTAVTAWQRGQFVFYDAPLAEVVAELNRYRTGSIVVANGALDRLRVTGVFKTGDPDAALRVIADTLPVRITRLTDYLVLLR